jgi:hypothetical protein
VNVAYSVKTPDADSGPYHSEAEVRQAVRAYRDEHGEDAVLRDVTVRKMTGRVGSGERLDVRNFL